MDLDEVQRYARHIALDDVGADGQEKFLAATVALIGEDEVLLETARMYLEAAGVGKIVDSEDGASVIVRAGEAVEVVGEKTSRIECSDAVVAGNLAAAEALWAILGRSEGRTLKLDLVTGVAS